MSGLARMFGKVVHTDGTMDLTEIVLMLEKIIILSETKTQVLQHRTTLNMTVINGFQYIKNFNQMKR